MVSPAWRKVVLVVGLALLVCLGVVLTCGQSRVGEFNPSTLASRERSAWGLPWTSSEWRVVLGPTRPKPQPSLVSWLVAQGYWAPAAPGKDMPWMRIYHYGPDWRDGHGEIQSDLLIRHASWVEWTAAHADWTPRFWAYLLETLRSDRPDRKLRVAVQLGVAKQARSWEEFLRMEAECMEE